MKSIAVLILFISVSLSAPLYAQSLQSKCGNLSGTALQICIAQWQADQQRTNERWRQFDDDLRQQENQQWQDSIRRQQELDRSLDRFRRGCSSFGPQPPECR